MFNKLKAANSSLYDKESHIKKSKKKKVNKVNKIIDKELNNLKDSQIRHLETTIIRLSNEIEELNNDDKYYEKKMHVLQELETEKIKSRTEKLFMIEETKRTKIWKDMRLTELKYETEQLKYLTSQLEILEKTKQLFYQTSHQASMLSMLEKTKQLGLEKSILELKIILELEKNSHLHPDENLIN